MLNTKSLLVLFFCIISCISATSQTQVLLKVSPVNIIHPVHPMIPIGVEFRSNNFGIEYEQGFQTPDIFFNWNYRRDNYTFTKAQLALKYYFLKNKEINYVALLSSYLPTSYTMSTNWLREGNEYFLYDQSDIKRRYVRLGVLLGFSRLTKRNLYFEYNLGAGINRRYVDHEIIGLRSTQFPFNYAGQYYNPERTEGTSNHFFLILSVKLGINVLPIFDRRLNN